MPNVNTPVNQCSKVKWIGVHTCAVASTGLARCQRRLRASDKESGEESDNIISVNTTYRNIDSNTYDEILVRPIRWLPFLLPSTHEPPSGNDALFDLRQMHLHHHTLPPALRISDFCHPVTRPSNLQEHLTLYSTRGGRDHEL